ncbi:hypothetical protein N7449_006551 [Penicillium cf. viridicatum]|uniref:Uncharacterized protein n=1 Tax=Penicillium cf. viridicatum TaxID=2972119 RepID=A0A9W9MDA5_9EURO|nr:hypothetical protein N7449_006551 [Penicillium cf. viridicatum]
MSGEGKGHVSDLEARRIFRCRIIVVFRAFSEDSLVVTHPTTNSPACGLSTAERTGSPVFHTLWSLLVDKEYNEYSAIESGY